MGDVLDILELNRDISEKKVIKKKRVSEPSAKKSFKGLNREVYALLCSDNKDNAPLIPSDFAISSKFGFPAYGYKKAKANLGLRKVVKWSWMPFTNPARKDGFQLYHWRREADKNKEYPFAKMNVVANVPTYTDVEYQEHLLSNEWSKNETDYLFKMCRKYDLRFVVIQDRWDKTNYKARSVEDIKDRYYSVFNIITKIRNETSLNFSSGINLKQQICIFDADHERKRKEQLIKLYNRTPEEVEEEQQLITELRKIEQRKKEREKKTQDLQKLITAADSTAELRRNEQNAQSRTSNLLCRTSRKKTNSQVKSSRVSDIGTSSMNTLNIESAGIKFPESKTCGVWLRSSRMKLPSSVGQKRLKAIDQLLNELKIDPHPMPTEEIAQHFNDLRSDMVLLYELKMALASLEFDLQSLKHQVDASSTQSADNPPTVPGTPVSAVKLLDSKNSTPLSSIMSTGKELKTNKDDSTTKKISEVLDVTNVTPRKRKAAMEQVNLMRMLRKN